MHPEYLNHYCGYDFVHCRTDDGLVFWTLNILDEFRGECLEIKGAQKLNSTNVIDALTELFILWWLPAFICSDNGLEVIAQAVRIGSPPFAQIQPISSQVRLGRTGIVKALIDGSEMNCLRVRPSKSHAKPKSSSENEENSRT